MKLLLAATILLAASGAFAQAPPTASAPAPSAAGLTERQQAIRDRLSRLEGNMIQLAKLLAESEPDKSDRLRDALDQAGRAQIKRRMEDLVKLLREANFGEADREQGAVLVELESMLRGLTDALGDLDRKREERERLAALKKDLEALQQRQADNIERTREAIAARQLAESLRRQADELEKLAARQAALREKRASPESAARLREDQAALAGEARAAADALKKLENDARDKPAARQAAQDAAAQTQQASEEMSQAAEALQAERDSAAAESQQKAEQALRRGAEKLREEADRLADAKRAREIERLEREAEQKAAEIARQMQPARSSDPQARPAPGAENVENAQKHMQRAADRLGENQPAEAEPEEQSASEQLERATEELDDALRQLRREEMEQTLATLEARFKAMLAREEQVKTDAVALAAKPRESWTRSDDLVLNATAMEQRKLIDDCLAVRSLLTTEGTTVVLPQMVMQLAADMTTAAGLLERSDVGVRTQLALDDVIAVLREIVGAVEQKRQEIQKEREEEQNDQGGPPDGAEPLLPGSAELRLLRSSQVRLNRRTEALQNAAAQMPATDLAAEQASLAARQTELSELARNMNERQP